jgi:hypothetical protein
LTGIIACGTSDGSLGTFVFPVLLVGLYAMRSLPSSLESLSHDENRAQTPDTEKRQEGLPFPLPPQLDSLISTSSDAEGRNSSVPLAFRVPTKSSQEIGYSSGSSFFSVK